MSCPTLLWGFFFPVKLTFAIQDDFIFKGVSKVVKLSKLFFFIGFFEFAKIELSSVVAGMSITFLLHTTLKAFLTSNLSLYRRMEKK